LKRKKLLTLVGSVCLILALAALLIPACAKEEAPAGPTPAVTYKWRMSGGDPPELADSVSMQKVCDTVREKTGGRLDITPYYAAILGSWDQTNEMCMRGDIEMLLEGLDDTFDPRLAIGYYMPYLYTGYEQACPLWAPGGFVYEMMNEMMIPLGYRTLGGWARGISGITVAELPPSPFDPDVPKNMKIRVMGFTACRLTFERMGYMTTAIPYGEVYTSLQTGVAEGQPVG